MHTYVHTYNPECLHSVRVCQSTLLQPHIHTYIRTYPSAGVALHELYLFISNILSTVGGWLLHRCQTQNLQQMVLHHIPGGGGWGWVGEGYGGFIANTVKQEECMASTSYHIGLCMYYVLCTHVCTYVHVCTKKVDVLIK